MGAFPGGLSAIVAAAVGEAVHARPFKAALAIARQCPAPAVSPNIPLLIAIGEETLMFPWRDV